MPIFEYEAKTLEGVALKGKIDALNEEVVNDTLRTKGYYPVRIREHKDSLNVDISMLQKLKIKEIAIFCRQFSVVINAGISILKGLEILIQQTENKKLKKILEDVFDNVQKGKSLSEAMKKHSDFPDMLSNMVTVGESSGTLDIIMDRMATYYDKENTLNQKIKSATTYPMVVSIFAIGVVIILVTKVLPTFVGMLTQAGTELPMPTRVLLATSHLLTTRWYIVMGGVAIIIVAYTMFARSIAGRRVIDKCKMKAPIFGKIYSKILTARFARTFGTLTGSGIPLLKSIEICSDVVGNVIVKDALDSTTDELKKGLGIGETLTARGIFPPMLTQMINIGEESGTLDSILEKTATFYDGEVDASTAQLTALIEPVIIVFLAIIVGFIILSIILPMFAMYDTVG